jgi:hypothetical protein
MSRVIDEARSELGAAQSALEAALRAWDESVSELWAATHGQAEREARI